MNLKTLKHINYENADEEWAKKNSHIQKYSVLRFKTPLARGHEANPANFLKRGPEWDKHGYTTARNRFYKHNRSMSIQS